MDTLKKPKKAFVRTFGCQMNEHDSQRMQEILSREGYGLTEQIDDASLILLNTCSVRENPENKVYSDLGRIRKLKAKRPDLVVGVGGCVAQQEGKTILNREPIVDMVFGTDNYLALPEMLEKVSLGERVLATEWMPREQKIQNFIPESEIKTGKVDGCKAYISITKGCDNFCSFCIVPMTRGRLVCREAENIVREAEDLVSKGAKEIMLLGQNVNSYRAHDVDFYKLLKMVADIPGLERVRFTSPYPNDWTDELSELMANHPNICNFLHLPFQAGSDRILSEMKRGHSADEYLRKMAYMRKINPGLQLSTDIIVGFPGETEEDFLGTLRIMQETRFAQIYAFKYSPRPGTFAQRKLEDDVPRKVKEERLARVLELQQTHTDQILDSYLGGTYEVLFDGAHPKEPDVITGRTSCFRPVQVQSHDLKIGDIVPVKIVSRKAYSLEGLL